MADASSSSSAAASAAGSAARSDARSSSSAGGAAAGSAARYVAHGAGHFLAEKAGMAGVDKAHVARVVEEASKGSKYYENAQKRDAQLCARIATIRDELARTPAAQIRALEQGMQAYAARQRAGAALSKVVVVVDMDAFYAAVSELHDPTLRGKAFAVGGMGMISTASYEARKYGVRSAMPGFIALKLCPHLIFVRHQFDRYTAAAEEARRVFRRYDPHMSSHSLDEAVLDITDHCVAAGILGRGDKGHSLASAGAAAAAASDAAAADAAASSSSAASDSGSSSGSAGSSADLFPPGLPWDPSAPIGIDDAAADDDGSDGDCSSKVGGARSSSSSAPADGVHSLAQHHAIAAVVSRMRHEVTVATRGLTCSAGIACNPMLAKIASNDRKPNGQCMVPFDPAAIAAYMRGLAVRKLPGVGKVTEKTLTDLGFATCGDVLDNMGRLRAAFNERTAHWLVRSSLGISDGERHGFAGMEAPGAASGDGDDGVGRKSISQERTFADCRDFNILAAKACELSRQIAAQMAEEGIVGRTVTVKMKLHNFEVRQRSITLPKPTADGKTIETNAVALLRAEMPCTLRLLGVRMSALAAKASKRTVLDAFVAKASAGTASSSAGIAPSSSGDGTDAGGGGGALRSVAGRKRSRPASSSAGGGAAVGAEDASGDHDDDRDSLATVPDERSGTGPDADDTVIEISSDDEAGDGDDDGIGSLGSAPSDDDDVDLQLDDIIDISRLSQASADPCGEGATGDDGSGVDGGRAASAKALGRPPPAKRRALEHSHEQEASVQGAALAVRPAAGAASASTGHEARALPSASGRSDDDVVLIADDDGDDDVASAGAAARHAGSLRSSVKAGGAALSGQLPWARAKPSAPPSAPSLCPVCSMTLSRSVQDINNHLDACLKSKQLTASAAAR